jgi:CHAT domain-containing protein
MRRSKTLLVGMPTTPGGHPALDGVATELEHLTGLLPEHSVLMGPRATRKSVLAALPQHSVVHLACHGASNWDDPMASGLLLHDHQDSPLTVADLAGLDLGDAQMAYLSACDTAVGNQRLADESVHLTSALQLAGYRHVIGTLWPVGDLTSARVTRDFYAKLMEEASATPRVERAPYALHKAIRGNPQYPPWRKS